MLKKVLSIIKNTDGSLVALQSSAVLIVVCIIVATFLSVYGTVIKKQQLDTLASEIKRTVELDGQYGDAERLQAQQLLSENHVAANVQCSQSGEIQLDDDFTITLTSTGSIGFGGSSAINIPLTSRADGKSEVYWR